MHLNRVQDLFSIHPRPGGKLDLQVFEQDGLHVIKGVLVTEDDQFFYPIIKGVPSFLKHYEHKANIIETFRVDGRLPHTPSDVPKQQELTNVTFSDKWTRFKNYGFEEQHETFLFDWYCKKLGFSDVENLKQFYKTKKRILEVGPGSGFNTKFMAKQCDGYVYALDISDAAYTTFENTCKLHNCSVIQADLNSAPFEDDFFDFIIADGVLHHTPDTKQSFFNLYRKLKPGGQFFFYVYKKMGAARQFCDQYIRDQFVKLSPDACYKACESLTELGEALSLIEPKITLKNPVPVLGIPAGEHSIQRLFYYNFVKCFWNKAFDFETNNMVNFDWYHPHNAWQHTQEEVESWLQSIKNCQYTIHDANPNGISVVCSK